MSASSSTMFGDLPPSSSVTFLRSLAAALTISLPTSVEPVKATLSTWLCAANGAPQDSPKPVTTLSTPGGKPASRHSCASRSDDRGVSSAGFNTTVQPAVNTGPNFQAAISKGKFHGIICATTPIGSLRVYAWYCASGV